MKRILYLSLLLVVPFFLHADHGRNKLNGKWISPYFDTEIKLKVKRHEVKVKGLSRNGWTIFTPVRRNVFEDCSGNRIKINSIHDLVYVNRYRGERIRFVKKGHNHHNHTCNSGCSIGDDYFSYSNNNDYYGGGGYNDNGYNGNGGNYNNGGSGYNGNGGNDYYNDWGNDDSWGYGNRKGDRYRTKDHLDNRFDGKYHVREINQYVTLNRTRNGLRAKRGNSQWVNYTQNRNRKNEYIDQKGNKYLMRSNGDITWKSRDGDVSLNLKK